MSEIVQLKSILLGILEWLNRMLHFYQDDKNRPGTGYFFSKSVLEYGIKLNIKSSFG